MQSMDYCSASGESIRRYRELYSSKRTNHFCPLCADSDNFVKPPAISQML